MRAAIVLLACLSPALAEDVTFPTEDGLTIAGTFQPAGKDAPTVICLPMYKNTKESYKRLFGPCVSRGLNVLAIDLRGHGKSEPDLAKRVNARDPKIFEAMHLDVEAAVTFLETKKGCDRTRLGLIGASVGCSVAIDFTRRHPGDVRAVVLLTPGSKYLGVDTLAHLKEWPGTSSFVFASTEERKTCDEVVTALARFHGGNHLLFPGSGMHGTRMLGKVTDLESLIADHFGNVLAKSVDLRPHDRLVLRRGPVSILVSPGKVRVDGGSATMSLDGKKKRLKPGESADWAWKPGSKLWFEAKPEKGKKLRFPSKGHFSVQPLLEPRKS